jgi:hypothetical protein
MTISRTKRRPKTARKKIRAERRWRTTATNSTGTRLRELPFSPERVRGALGV